VETNNTQRKRAILVLLFILVFILGFIFGCFYCSFGGTGSVTFDVADESGDIAPDGTTVTLVPADGAGDSISEDVGGDGEVEFDDIPAEEYTVEVDGENVVSVNGDNGDTFTVTEEEQTGVSIVVEETETDESFAPLEPTE